MIRIIPLVLALVMIAPVAAYADDPPPTPEQIEQAKKAFAEGKKLHESGKYAEAIEKFKESYRLSKNPLLLYNIGFTMDEAKEADMALFYYRKFLKEAPADAQQRPSVVERVKVLEQQFNPNSQPDPFATNPANPTNPQPPVKPEPTVKPPVQIKPPGTYGAGDFEHQVIETAPPGKPLDITAFVPEDSGFVVTLYFRTAGEGKFTSKVMKWRYKELVGRIPAPKMIGNAVQYYIEVKDTTGAVVTRNAKSTSPNLVNLEAGATPRFYPDLTDEGEAVSPTEIRKRDEDDDPLNRNKKIKKQPDEPPPVVVGPPALPGNGFRDVGSQKFRYAKWGSTGAAVALVGLSVVFFVQSGNYARALEDDSTMCGTPPCRNFDSYSSDVQSTGKTYQTMSNVTFGLGVAATAVAGYFWYRELTAKKRGELNVSTKKGGPAPETSTWDVAPLLGNGITGSGFFGAAAAKRF